MAWSQPQRKNKLNAKKVVLDGIVFASRKEARYYQRLKLLKAAGEIVSFEMQVPFIAIINNVECFKYFADFVEYYPDGSRRIVDVKGYKKGSTYAHFRTKKKVIQALYGVEIVEV